MENIHKWIWLLKKIWLLGTSLQCLSNMKTIEYICFVILVKTQLQVKIWKLTLFHITSQIFLLMNSQGRKWMPQRRSYPRRRLLHTLASLKNSHQLFLKWIAGLPPDAFAMWGQAGVFLINWLTLIIDRSSSYEAAFPCISCAFHLYFSVFSLDST